MTTQTPVTAVSSSSKSTEAYLEDTVNSTYKVTLTHKHLDPKEGMDFVRCPQAGAIVYFGGTTRDTFPVPLGEGVVEEKKVTQLEYESYVPMAIQTLAKIAQKSLKATSSTFAVDGCWPNPICKVYIAHRLGVVPVCEESVVIAISAPHRKEGWMAAEWILEEVKRSAEIWKNEVYEDGSTLWKANDGSKPTGH